MHGSVSPLWPSRHSPRLFGQSVAFSTCCQFQARQWRAPETAQVDSMGDAMRRPMESDVDTTPFMEWLAVLSSIVVAVLVFAAYSQMAS